MGSEPEGISAEFVRAIEEGKQNELARQGFAAIASLVTSFYDALVGRGLPGALVHDLTCDFATTILKSWVLNPATQAQAGGGEPNDD